jgi:hypothetical protein
MKPPLRMALKALMAHIILFGGAFLLFSVFDPLVSLLPKIVAFIIHVLMSLIVVGTFVHLHYQLSKEAANSRAAGIGVLLSGSLPGWMFLVMFVLVRLPMFNST